MANPQRSNFKTNGEVERSTTIADDSESEALGNKHSRKAARWETTEDIVCSAGKSCSCRDANGGHGVATHAEHKVSALKGIVSDVIPDALAPYSESNEDRKIEACLSAIGVYKRMCLDVIKVGGMNKIVVEKKRKLKEKYGERVKAELKKL